MRVDKFKVGDRVIVYDRYAVFKGNIHDILKDNLYVFLDGNDPNRCGASPYHFKQCRKLKKAIRNATNV